MCFSNTYVQVLQIFYLLSTIIYRTYCFSPWFQFIDNYFNLFNRVFHLILFCDITIVRAVLITIFYYRFLHNECWCLSSTTKLFRTYNLISISKWGEKSVFNFHCRILFKRSLMFFSKTIIYQTDKPYAHKALTCKVTFCKCCMNKNNGKCQCTILIWMFSPYLLATAVYDLNGLL